MSLTTGARVGAYEIVARLGAGGMGEVYRAQRTAPNAMIARVRALFWPTPVGHTSALNDLSSET